MNIFEQYGIKEVADVCLYAIELDENDDEIYIPIMYLDTLKVSTVEETAEQTSARGGLGNPELIIWDYGKEISIKLTDALYTPASQGMTWGGKFGVKNFTLYGDLQSISTGVKQKASLTLSSFSDFNITAEGTRYAWKVTVNVVDNIGRRFSKENITISCDRDNYDWMFGGYRDLSNTIDSGEYRFVLNSDYNKNITPPQEVIYQIDHALKNVYYLDRMEKCKASRTFVIDTSTNTAHGNYRYMQQYSQCELTVFIDPKTMQPYEPNTDSFEKKDGSVVTGKLRIIKQDDIYYKWTRSKALDNTSLGHQIVVDATHFPGTYRLVGETYSRSRNTGKDQRFQFEIPLCKMGTENNFTFEAEGDPTTFDMTLKVLRREDGVMMKLTQYSVENAKYDGQVSGSTKVSSNDEILSEDTLND